ncbi:hypothetical protein BH09BAC1_BH09BAC1_18990 [soil metagenome]
MKFAPYILLLVLFSSLIACEKGSDAPHNPYDDVDYLTPPAPVDTLQKNTIVWLHKNIFESRCAQPGCHVGNFEPDFRTVESSFATLVYHPIVKNSQDSAFKYRVVPYDTANSVLHERITNCCFVGVNDRMPQDNIGVPLEQDKIDAIAAWIMAGAPDMMGAVRSQPNKKPSIDYFLAANANFSVNLSLTNNRIDSVYYNPFAVDNNMTINIVPFITDDNTSYDQLKYNKLLTSYNPDDFSTGAAGYREYNAVYTNLGAAGRFWIAAINTANYTPNTIVYMRYYTQDDVVAPIVEMPMTSMITPYKTYWSFYVKP